MTIQIPSFVIGMTLMVPPIIVGLWMLRCQINFFNLAKKKKLNIPRQEEFMNNPLDIFHQVSMVKKWNDAFQAHHNDRELDAAARKVRTAYYFTFIAMIASFIMVVGMVIISGR